MSKKRNIKLRNPIEKYFSKVTRYHYYLFFLLFTSKIPVFWHVLNLIFISPPMSYTCGTNENSTNVCPCDTPLWDRSVFSETMQTKFGLFCDSSWLISFSHSIMYVGFLIGSMLFGFLSDRFGRLPIFTLSCLILGVSGCLVSAMPTYAAFIVMRCIEGIGTGGAIVTPYVLCIEYCGVKHREIITALFHIPINISHLLLPGISYALRHCDEFQFAISAPVFLIVLYRWLIMESPKWLMDSGHIDEAVAVMEKIAAFNRDSCENIRKEIEEYNANTSSKTSRNLRFFQIFKHKKIVLNLCYMSVIYFLCGMGYYGISQYIGKMSGNIHLNVAISGAMLLPGTILSVYLLKTLNRRTFLMSTNFLSGLFIIIVVCIPQSFNTLRVIFACVCNCFFFMSFIIVFLYSVELFPTAVRNSVLGFLSVLSRIGQITAPQINQLSELLAGVIFGTLALIGTGICYLLPETKHMELPSNFDESKMLSRKKLRLEDDEAVQNNRNNIRLEEK